MKAILNGTQRPTPKFSTLIPILSLEGYMSADALFCPISSSSIAKLIRNAQRAVCYAAPGRSGVKSGKRTRSQH